MSSAADHGQADIVWLDARTSIGVGELALVCGLSPQDVHELIGYGALALLAPDEHDPRISCEVVVPLRQAARLRQTYDLDMFTVGLLLECFSRIEELERRLHGGLPGGS